MSKDSELVSNVYLLEYIIISGLNVDWGSLSVNPNLTWDLIKKYINKPWRWADISKHKCITWDIIINNPKIDWNWDNISRNPNITLEIVSNNYNNNWDYSYISSLPYLTVDIIKKYGTRIRWDWSVIYMLNIKKWKDIFVKENGIIKEQIPYTTDRHWEDIMWNPNIYLNDLMSHERWRIWWKQRSERMIELDVYDDEWNNEWNNISHYPDNIWLYYYIYSNNDILLQCIIDNPLKRWNWVMITKHPSITWEIIVNHNLLWKWGILFENPNIDIKIVKYNLHRPWD
jgi:hypothetical protein